MGYRWARLGLRGGSRRDVVDDLLLLGVQDTRPSGAAHSLSQRANRIGSKKISNAVSPDGPLVSMWSVRGAPHAHRLADLDLVRDTIDGPAAIPARARERTPSQGRRAELRPRCDPGQWRGTRSRGEGGERAWPVTARAGLPLRRRGISRPRCTAAGRPSPARGRAPRDHGHSTRYPARRTANRRRPCSSHQAMNWRKSKAYASRVRPR